MSTIQGATTCDIGSSINTSTSPWTVNNPHTNFNYGDEICFLSTFYDVYGSSDVRMEFWNDVEGLVWTVPYTIPDARGSGWDYWLWYCVYWYWDGVNYKFPVGNWTMRVYGDGVFKTSKNFTVTEPSGTGYITNFTAPTEAEVGSTVVITTYVYCGSWGDYYNYIVDADTGSVIDSTVIYPTWAGNYTFRNDLTMPDKDLNYRIEYYDEVPPGYPRPI